MYGGQTPADFVKKFEQPYAPLLAAGVKFQASLGNHDRPENVSYKPLQHERPALLHLRRATTSGSSRSTARSWIAKQRRMARRRAAETRARTGRSATSIIRCTRTPSRHGSSVDLRVLLEPIFVKYGVNVVFSGHDHVYERLKPQKGIYYFVSGAAGQLRRGNMDAVGADRRVLRSGPELHARGGRRSGDVLPGRSRAPAQTVDSGVIQPADAGQSSNESRRIRAWRATVPRLSQFAAGAPAAAAARGRDRAGLGQYRLPRATTASPTRSRSPSTTSRWCSSSR